MLTPPDKMEWEVHVSILRTSIIMNQLAIAIGIPFGLLAIFMLFIKAYYGLALMAILFLATIVFIMVVWGGTYQVGFALNQESLRAYTQDKQAKRNKITNWLAMALGVLTANPTVAGAAMLATSQQNITLKWSNIKKVTYHPKKQLVQIKCHLTQYIPIFCTPENYKDVALFISTRLMAQKK